MFVLSAEKRDTNQKVKQLRKDGLVPAAIFGSGIDDSILLQVKLSDVTRLLKTNSKDSKVEIEIDGKKDIALLRDISYNPLKSEVEHLGLQRLVADEMVTSSAQIVLVNREKIPDLIQHTLFDISYKALPSKLVDKVEIDLEGMKIGDAVIVSDLDIAKDDDIELLTDPDTLIVSITDRKKAVVDTGADEAGEGDEAVSSGETSVGETE